MSSAVVIAKYSTLMTRDTGLIYFTVDASHMSLVVMRTCSLGMAGNDPVAAWKLADSMSGKTTAVNRT